MRLVLISTASILVLFGLVFCGFFAYRKYVEHQRGRECVIHVKSNGDIFIDGNPIGISELGVYLNRRAKSSKDWDGKTSINSPDHKQPFPLKVVSDRACLYKNVQQTIEAVLATYIYTRVTFAAPGEKGTSLNFGPRFVPKGSDQYYIDYTRLRVKLLWYSPNGRPRYTKPDSNIILKIRGAVFGEPGKPDWKALEKCIRIKLEARRANTRSNNDFSPITLDGRRHIPMRYVLKALQVMRKAGFEDIFLAAPEIPY
jgi:biopolymer transport protein ExbD